MINYDMCPVCKGSMLMGSSKPCTCQYTGITITTPVSDEPIIHNRVIYDRASDPTLHHCQHKIADMNKYPYCPECGERV